MLEAVERLFQVFVVEFEVGEFELERVVRCLQRILLRQQGIVVGLRDGSAVAGEEK